jgi:hypothetical protein
MPLYGVETKLKPDEAVERAVAYFGAGGLGLEVERQNPCCATFTGGGGHVTVTARLGEDKRTLVQLETREWDYHVKQFMQKIG